MRGVGGVLLPSFSPDLVTLDPAGIGWDVRQAIESGFWGVSCANPALTLQETKDFLTIACDAAGGRVGVGAMLERPTFDEQRAVLRHAEEAGCSQAFVLPPRSLRPLADSELYDWYFALIGDARIPVVLYAHHNPAMAALDPSGVPFEVYDRLADLPQVAAMKLTQPIDPVTAADCCRRFGDRLVINVVNVALAPLLSELCPIQTTADWLVQAVQSPERPYLSEFMALVAEGRRQEASGLYWRFAPAVRAFYALQAPMLMKGAHPWAHMKYFQWSVGGNGGALRPLGLHGEPVPPLTDDERARIAQTYRDIGIETRATALADFLIGRAASAAG